MEPPLRAQHREVIALRDLLRDRKERSSQGLFVIDGPRAVDGAFDRNVAIEQIFIGEDANEVAVAVTGRAFETGVPVVMLERGVAERVSDVRSAPGIFALCRTRPQAISALDSGDLWIVLPSINDPGNLGTILRSAEAAGVSGIALGRGSVDVYNPKVVRASAGAIFGLPIVEGDAITMLNRLGERGVTRYGAASSDATAASMYRCALDRPVAIVLGHETRGIRDLNIADAEAGALPIDGVIAIPMDGSAESLNVAMAATVLMFEAARQRAAGQETPKGS